MSEPVESKRTAGAGGQSAGAGVTSRPLASGLYLVATPIGNAADMTLRAIDVLGRADAIAAEDTRQTRKLMDIHGISLNHRPMISYNDVNGAEQRPRIERWLSDGLVVAYCSDAGMPLIADPGFRLVEAAIAGGHGLTSVPGAAAALVALQLSGLPSDRFLFAGFLPPKSAARQKAISEWATLPATLIFYESPRRLAACLDDMIAVLGPERPAVVARELTKRFEELRRGPLGELRAGYDGEATPKGEVVLLIGPPDPEEMREAQLASLDDLLTDALRMLSVKDAAKEVAAKLDLPRREVYARALELAGK